MRRLIAGYVARTRVGPSGSSCSFGPSGDQRLVRTSAASTMEATSMPCSR